MSDPSESKPLSSSQIFGMYIEGAKWLLAIIAGMLVYGLDRALDKPLSGASLITFMAAAAFLVFAAGLDLRYLLKSFTYASRRVEFRRKFGDHRPANPDSPPDTLEAALKTDWRDAVLKVSDPMAKAGTAFPWMIRMFGVGAFIYVTWGAIQIVLAEEKPQEAQFEIDGQTVAVRRGETIWVLQRTSKGTAWLKLPALPGSDDLSDRPSTLATRPAPAPPRTPASNTAPSGRAATASRATR